jgi:methylase of polypeptide subunit release factors
MYPVSEDSLFFSELLKKYFSRISMEKKEKIKYLDMGTGSQILAETAEKAGIRKENILCIDIDKECVNLAKKKGFKAIKSNLFSNLKINKNKKEKFDVISFNAPYLPEDKYDKKPDTTGGKKGDEISLRFLKQAKKYLNKNGKIFLLISSLTPFNRIKKFNPEIIARKMLFFEELILVEI